MMNKNICEQCNHKSVCYKYKEICSGDKTFDDFFGELLCKDLLIITSDDCGNTEEWTVDANIYDISELYEDCTVEVLKNSVTGKISVGWWRNDKPPICFGGE